MHKERYSLQISVVITTLVLSIMFAPTARAQYDISWEDFRKTEQKCGLNRCVQWGVRHVWRCDTVCFSNTDCRPYCGMLPESYCVREEPSCREVRKMLPDGDLIDVQIEENAIDPSIVEFVIETPQHITWYKGITVPDGTGAQWVISTKDAKHRDVISLWAHQVHNGQSLLFTKAGFLGWWKNSYRLGGLERLNPGSRVTFRWIVDSW